jgi:amino acid permease
VRVLLSRLLGSFTLCARKSHDQYAALHTTVTALSVVYVVYAVTALSGYFTCGDSTMGDILKNYGKDDPYAVGGRLAMAFCIVFTCRCYFFLFFVL